jgi:predicted double-glycine peptidase
MLIGYHEAAPMDVDTLLAEGIAAGSFLPTAGWTHAGLIDLARPYGLTGASHSLAHQSVDDALATLRQVVGEAPVMASVHYTFEPTNPIPHLVVVTGIDDTTVYYNDPAEPTGEGAISIEKFQRAWKQRYISIVPVS